MKRSASAPLIVLCLAVGPACESDAERCDAARLDAEQAWLTYERELAADLEAERKNLAMAQEKLAGTVEKRMADVASKQADARFDRTSSAWMRAFTSAKLNACKEDEECEELERKRSGAVDAIALLEPRLLLVRKARAAVHDAPAAAKASADAVGEDFDYASMKRAREASRQAFEHCKQLQPASDEL